MWRLILPSLLLALPNVCAVSYTVATGLNQSASPLVFDLSQHNTSDFHLPRHRLKRQISSNLHAIENGVTWTVGVLIDKQPFHLVLDTGSADLWVATDNFVCRDTSDYTRTGTCHIPKTYTGYYTRLHDWIFSIKYGSGEAVSGVFGAATFQVGGSAASNAPVAFANWVAYDGDGITSGIWGLGKREVTSALDGRGAGMFYDPVLYVLCDAHGLPRRFGVALGRDKKGSLVVGGQFSGNYFEVPIQGAEYQITVTAVTIQGSSSREMRFETNLLALLDTGISKIWLPPSIADTFASKYRGSQYLPDAEVYNIPCTELERGVQRLQFSFQNGNTIDVNIKDFTYVWHGLCRLAITKGEDNEIILGLPFLRNVLVDVDITGNKVGLAQR